MSNYTKTREQLLSRATETLAGIESDPILVILWEKACNTGDIPLIQKLHKAVSQRLVAVLKENGLPEECEQYNKFCDLLDEIETIKSWEEKGI